jgi:hypothetical protein
MSPKAKGIVLISIALIVLTVLAMWAGTPLPEVLFQFALIAAGIILALAYADLGKPRLAIEPVKPEDIYIGQEKVRWIHLVVSNRPRRGLPFIARSTAFSCHGTIAFMDIEGRQLFDMSIRWSANPQPIQRIAVGRKLLSLPDPNLIRASRYIDIPADEAESLDVCFRAPRQATANAWNSENYQFQGSRHPKRRLSMGQYLIQVVIKHNDGAVSARFVLQNPRRIRDFRLARP